MGLFDLFRRAVDDDERPPPALLASVRNVFEPGEWWVSFGTLAGRLRELDADAYGDLGPGRLRFHLQAQGVPASRRTTFDGRPLDGVALVDVRRAERLQAEDEQEQD